MREQACQHDPLERAAGRFWLVLGLGGSDRAETEQSQSTTLELLLQTGGKPSTWLPPGELVEHSSNIKSNDDDSG